MTTTLPPSISLFKMTFHDQNFIDIPGIIQKELTNKEIMEIDMRLLGDIILRQAKALTLKVNHELLRPISIWIDDPEWMKKFQCKDNERPNWAKYKQRSRQWTKQQKTLSQQRLKLYWQKIRQKRQYLKEISQVLYTNERNRDFKVEGPLKQSIDTTFLSDILTPFSPIEKHRTETAFEFNQSYKLSISDLLPWKTIIISEITENGSTTLNDMRIYLTENKKLDKISKFQHLLQMVMDGEVSLEQTEHVGQIQIVPKSENQRPEIRIKNKSGHSYHFDWPSLNDTQRNKIITDAISRKILCRSVNYE